jgi:hypothetical protein
MRFFLGISLGVLACLLVLEVFLRFLPVNSGVRMEATSVEKPFSRYLPHQQYVYSFGWGLGTAKSGVTNSNGFTNSPDSSEKGGILVVGDSYIESFMLDFPETIQGHLAEKLPNKVQTVSASGNGLADSLQILKYFTPQIKPSVVVLFVEPFDLSLLLEKPAVGHNGFVVTNETQVSVIHSPYTESPNKELLLRSALIRYLYYNLKFPDWASKALSSLGGKKPEFVDPTDKLEPKKQLALNYYFSELSTLGHTNGFRVVFLLDGDRKAIYSKSRDQSWNAVDRELFLKLALKHQLDVVDMQPDFQHDWDQKHERMDFLPMDGHWNPVAHRLAADKIMRLLDIK